MIKTATPASIRAINRFVVLDTVRKKGSCSRAQISRITGLFRSTVGEIVEVLLSQNLLIQRQAQLEREAREAVPFSFTKGGCTYERGYMRQPVYACRTCGGGGVCAGCSVGCHAGESTGCPLVFAVLCSVPHTRTCALSL